MMMNIIDQALECLAGGGVIIYPSESCYGLGCDARSKTAVEAIHRLKGEAVDKPIAVLVSDINQIKRFGILNPAAMKLAEHFYPAQLTIIIDCLDPTPYPFL